MSEVKMPDPFGWITRESYFGLKAGRTSCKGTVPLHATSSTLSKTPLFTADHMEAYADAKVREALTWEDVWRLVRNTGYVTKGQADEIADLILAHLRGEQPAPGAQEGA